MKAPVIDSTMQEIIDARVEAIRQAHASNMTEGLNMDADEFEAMLKRAREPVSNKEFRRREEELWFKRHQIAMSDAP